MELILQALMKATNITTNHIIAIALVIVYFLGLLVFKYLMRNHPKIEDADGSKKYR